MKKLFYFACLMFTMTSASVTMTSCGDDKPEVVTPKNLEKAPEEDPGETPFSGDSEGSEEASALVGTWRVYNSDNQETSPVLSKLESYITFKSDNTYEEYTKLPDGIKETLTSTDAKNFDDNNIMFKSKGSYVFKNDSITITTSESYCFMDFGDWEWHKSGEIQVAKVVFDEYSKDAFTSIYKDENGNVEINDFYRIKE